MKLLPFVCKNNFSKKSLMQRLHKTQCFSLIFMFFPFSFSTRKTFF